MLKFNIKIDDKITPLLKKQEQALKKLPDEAYKFFVQETPIRSGNARRKTTKNGKQIRANYPYAQRLDEGYSKQSPEGMTQPTEEFVLNRFNDIMTGKI